MDHKHDDAKTTHFGYQRVSNDEKTAKVTEVFDSVANRYDLMNDLMSFGIHRLWKRFAIHLSQIRPGQTIMDLAGGSGDLTARIMQQLGNTGQIVLVDINQPMLERGRDRLVNKGLINSIEYVQANGESLPFHDNSFDHVIISFGLRNITNIPQALTSMYRVLKPGGQALILEFSKPTLPINAIYDFYSFKILPTLGKFIAGDADSYRYLAESIRMHPDQETLKEMMINAGFSGCEYFNLTAGIVSIHKGYKF